ncbi:hypothetical protein T4B_44 [Trichinella pseudospiralis]|uniref:Uncharacterized protein n=1 Tax=Trichinella pseudospiralis TaxID=6337 RepID=A0A0V1JVI1_TRIPS|nr:hypothetical protein T4B_44 [Trichinella pseudospiralis]KRZ38999.1 hypothetical protein T4C_9604 [Trichinella pseudospiralis]
MEGGSSASSKCDRPTDFRNLFCSKLFTGSSVVSTSTEWTIKNNTSVALGGSAHLSTIWSCVSLSQIVPLDNPSTI